LLIPCRKPFFLGDQQRPKERCRPESRVYVVTTTTSDGQRCERPVLAETDRLALQLAARLFLHETLVAVDGVPLLGRCLRCQAFILKSDWHERRRSGLVCESCPLGFALQMPPKRRLRR
jgi:hypothetical protein